MENTSHNVRLAASEIGNLWTQFLNDSQSVCVFTYFLENVKDKEIKSILQLALSLSEEHIVKIKEFLVQENYPIPQGFTKEDVKLNAPPLFSDTFMLVYLYAMTLHGLNGYSLAVGNSARADQRKYYMQCSTETMDLYDKVLDLMLEKGIYSRGPFINPPHDVDFVTKQNFLTGWFGQRRPLNAVELSNIYYNMQKTVVKVELEIGFSQVSQSKDIRAYFLRGADICKKHLEVLGSILNEDDLHSPKTLASEVTNSTIPPFSDKLMMYHIVSLLSVAAGYYGAALSVCQRRDLFLQYTRLMAEVGQYAEDG